MIRRLIILLIIARLYAESIPVEISNRGNNWWTERAFLKNHKDLLISPIRILNTGNKTIKNISIEVNAYNKQDSILEPSSGNRICIVNGPIKPKETHKTSMKCGTYYKKHIEYLTLQAIYVEYTDDSTNSSPSKLYKFTLNLEELNRRTKYAPLISGIVIAIVWSHFMVP